MSKIKILNSDEITLETRKWMCREFNILETMKQLRNPDPIRFASWGVGDPGNLSDKALIFSVRGQLFEGLICITLGAMDTYDVHFMKPHQSTPDRKGGFEVLDAMTLTDVYCDQLAELVDTAIETPKDYGKKRN